MVEQMALRNFSPRTQESYVGAIVGLARFYKRSPDQLTGDQLQKYLLSLQKDRHLAWSTCNVAVSGIRFLYGEVLGRKDLALSIPPRKSKRQLPLLLSIEEVRLILETPTNPKHRALLWTAYGAGLRVSELVCLKPCHIESQRGWIRVEQGKGRKDRYTLLPGRLLQELRSYYKVCRPQGPWLFPGFPSDRHISDSSVQRVFARVKRKAGVTRGRNIHTLRHCFCTHLLEAGYDISEVKEMMGHSSLATTMIYRHISPERIREIRSPLDTKAFA
jgi:site-specific recombinase XerD